MLRIWADGRGRQWSVTVGRDSGVPNGETDQGTRRIMFTSGSLSHGTILPEGKGLGELTREELQVLLNAK